MSDIRIQQWKGGRKEGSFLGTRCGKGGLEVEGGRKGHLPENDDGGEEGFLPPTSPPAVLPCVSGVAHTRTHGWGKGAKNLSSRGGKERKRRKVVACGRSTGREGRRGKNPLFVRSISFFSNPDGREMEAGRGKNKSCWIANRIWKSEIQHEGGEFACLPPPLLFLKAPLSPTKNTHSWVILKRKTLFMYFQPLPPFYS